jgi:hypothetical protein
MGGAGFGLLKTGDVWPESRKQLKVPVAGIRKILSIRPGAARRPEPCFNGALSLISG